jgi:glycolate oxidase FAD binding subunit
VRLSGAEPAVRAARLLIGGEGVEPTVAAQWWSALRHCRHPLFEREAIWRLSLPPTAPALALSGELLIDWGGALRWYAGEIEPSQVRNIASAAGGTAACWRGPAPEGRFHPLAPMIAAIHRRLKQHFDPHGIFNPGRLVTDL